MSGPRDGCSPDWKLSHLSPAGRKWEKRRRGEEE